MKFEEILFQAKMNDTKSIKQIIDIYRPLLVKNALINGKFDEDLYQELMIVILKCIHNFNIMNI